MRRHGGRAERPHLVHQVLSLAEFWRNAVSDHVVATAEIGPGDVVVDIGAGVGPATVPATRQGAEVVAVDPSRLMRTAPQLRRLWQRGRDRIRIVAGSAERLPLDDGTADATIAANAMHHWADMDAAVGELLRVLRPGGRLVLADEDVEDPARERAGTTTTHNAAYPMIDPGLVAGKLAAAGFDARSARLTVAGRPVLLVTGRAPS